MKCSRTMPSSAVSMSAFLKNRAATLSEIDEDGDCKLDFEEFYASLPQRLVQTHNAETIRSWFSSADTNGDGTLSVNEFFRFSLSNAALRYGSRPLEESFARFDTNGSGCLDAREFEALAGGSMAACADRGQLQTAHTSRRQQIACKHGTSIVTPRRMTLHMHTCAPPDDMGFGARAHEIFAEFDTDGSGSIAYGELISAMHANQPMNEASRQLFTSLAWASDASSITDAVEPESAESSWRINGNDVRVSPCPRPFPLQDGRARASVLARAHASAMTWLRFPNAVPSPLCRWGRCNANCRLS